MWTTPYPSLSPSLDMSFYMHAYVMCYRIGWVSDNRGRPRLVCVHRYTAIFMILSMVEGAYTHTHTHTHKIHTLTRPYKLPCSQIASADNGTSIIRMKVHVIKCRAIQTKSHFSIKQRG